MANQGPASISVIINVYDEAPRHLNEAIESVFAQTIAPEEVLIVEDGALRDYEPIYQRFPDVRVIRQANGGLAAARNAGLIAARGTFILFLDGDDRMVPHSLAINLKRLTERRDAVMSYGAYCLIDGDGRERAQVRLCPVGSDAYLTMLEGNCIGMHATVLYRREALLAAGGFDPAFRACEDYDLYLRMARLGPILHGPEILAHYRLHNANMSSNSLMMLRTALRVLDNQGVHVKGDRHREIAQKRGRVLWKRHYARAQILATLAAVTKGKQVPRAGIEFFRMFSRIPFVMIRMAAVELLRRIKRGSSPGR